MVTQSMDEMKAEYIAAMGEDLGTAFSALDHNVIELHVLWQHYRELFGTDPEVCKLLSRTADSFFRVVQDALWDSALLGILRLTDKAEASKWKNLSLETLATFIPDSELEFKEAVVKLVESARKKSKDARKHRDKRIAHQDLRYGICGDWSMLSPISRNIIEEVLAAIRAVMHCFQMNFKVSKTSYEKVIVETGASLFVAKLKHFESLDSASRNSE